MTEKGRHQGDAVILEIASDKKSVILSQVVNTAYQCDIYLPGSEIAAVDPHRERRPGISVDR